MACARRTDALKTRDPKMPESDCAVHHGPATNCETGLRFFTSR